MEDVWLVLDKISLHKTQDVYDLVGQMRQTLVFPLPYSQIMNPIEGVFSKVKFCTGNILADPSNQARLTDVMY